MTNQHPLTDEKCEDLSPWYIANFDEYDADRTRRGMRAAADWQLEQVMEWGYKYLYPDQVNALRKAMRPQQQEDN